MQSRKAIVNVGRFLSLVLRHKPEAANIQLDTEGWVSLHDLVEGSRTAGRADVTVDSVMAAVQDNNKQRFEVDGDRIRAVQGHSVDVDLKLVPAQPPDVLYHGTAQKHVDSIFRLGLLPRGRQHVHLSADVNVAHEVGRRHGQPVVLVVPAGQMWAKGHVFYQSKNGVWLTDAVPPDDLTLRR